MKKGDMHSESCKPDRRSGYRAFFDWRYEETGGTEADEYLMGSLCGVLADLQTVCGR